MAQVSTTGRRASRFHGRLIAPAVAAVDASRPRYHAFDALRGMAMFLVIGSHVAFAYVEHDIRGVLWCVRDSPTWPAFDWFCWWSMGVLEPLIFHDRRIFRGHAP